MLKLQRQTFKSFTVSHYIISKQKANLRILSAWYRAQTGPQIKPVKSSKTPDDGAQFKYMVSILLHMHLYDMLRFSIKVDCRRSILKISEDVLFKMYLANKCVSAFFHPKFQMCLNIIQPMVCYPFVRVHALKIKNSGADMHYTVYQNMMHDRKAQRPVTLLVILFTILLVALCLSS